MVNAVKNSLMDTMDDHKDDDKTTTESTSTLYKQISQHTRNACYDGLLGRITTNGLSDRIVDFVLLRFDEHQNLFMELFNLAIDPTRNDTAFRIVNKRESMDFLNNILPLADADCVRKEADCSKEAQGQYTIHPNTSSPIYNQMHFNIY